MNLWENVLVDVCCEKRAVKRVRWKVYYEKLMVESGMLKTTCEKFDAVSVLMYICHRKYAVKKCAILSVVWKVCLVKGLLWRVCRGMFAVKNVL